jgi:quinol monooxygenase YgiN
MTLSARADPACLTYVMTVDPVDPAVVTIFEIWRDVESFAAYARSDYAAAYARRTAGLRVGPTLVTLLHGEVRHSGPAPDPAQLGALLGG